MPKGALGSLLTPEECGEWEYRIIKRCGSEVQDKIWRVLKMNWLSRFATQELLKRLISPYHQVRKSRLKQSLLQLQKTIN